MHKKFTALSIISVIFVAGGLMLFLGPKESFFTKSAHAGSGDALHGFAWSETIGWISFNSTDCDLNGDGIFNDAGAPAGCPTSGTAYNYGVNVDANGNFSGYAWSENVGWISFNRSDANNPPNNDIGGGSGPIAKFDSATNTIQGWTRALSACKNNLWDNVNLKCTGSGAGDAAGGWDGWIKLQSTSGEQAYGVTYNTTSQQFQGFAWGGDVVGWISFNCSDTNSCGSSQYAVGGSILILSNLSVAPAYCGSPQSETFSWSVSGGSGQTNYEIQVANNSGFSPTTVDATIASTSDTVVLSSNPQANQLAYGSNYYWRVRAVGGSWSNGPSFNTPAHFYPQPGLKWSPTSPSQGQIVAFSDQTTFAAGSTNHAWQWSIPNATYVDGTTSTSQNPHVKFNSNQSVVVTLTATDDAGSCSTPSSGPGTQITVKPPLPHFKEVQPR